MAIACGGEAVVAAGLGLGGAEAAFAAVAVPHAVRLGWRWVGGCAERRWGWELCREADEPGWEVDPDDEWGVVVITTVGRQLKPRREAMDMRVPEFAAAMGYGDDLAYKVESGKRIPQREYLVKADEVLDAGGLVAAAWEDVKRIRYPKTVRDIAKLEARAVELTAYGTHNLHGLLQTADYMHALFEMRRPAMSS
ncbi:hypothetical protein GCM10027073_50870 [Streptomyces chlorus]